MKLFAQLCLVSRRSPRSRNMAAEAVGRMVAEAAVEAIPAAEATLRAEATLDLRPGQATAQSGGCTREARHIYLGLQLPLPTQLTQARTFGLARVQDPQPVQRTSNASLLATMSGRTRRALAEAR